MHFYRMLSVRFGSLAIAIALACSSADNPLTRHPASTLLGWTLCGSLLSWLARLGDSEDRV